jgi:predicted metalloendopeptidase
VCFVDEYSQFRIADGTPVDGRLTLGENLADNGGLRLEWGALQPSNTGRHIDGFTPAQRFFLAWGQIRCETRRPKPRAPRCAASATRPDGGASTASCATCASSRRLLVSVRHAHGADRALPAVVS